MKLFDGTSIYLRKPNQAMFMKLLSFQHFDQKNDQEVMDTFVGMVLAILNTNTAGRKFAAEDIADFDFGIL